MPILFTTTNEVIKVRVKQDYLTVLTGNTSVTNALNLGNGVGIFAQRSGSTLQFKSLVAGNNITLVPSSTGITISSSSGVDYAFITGNTLTGATTPFIYDTQTTVPNVFSYKTNTDIIGTGQVIMTNGSNIVSGISTNFLNSTTGRGVSYWFQIWIKDSTNSWYYIEFTSITNNTRAVISRVLSRNLIRAGGHNNSGNASNVVWPTTYTGVTGTYNYYIGSRNWSDGLYSVAIGNNAYADNFSISLGGGATGVGISSIAIGQKSFAGNSNSTALGAMTRATGTQSTAIGYRTEATGNFSTALGVYSIAGGIGSVAIGKGFDPTGTVNDRALLASAQGSIILSENDINQTLGHGALAINSAILGGLNHNIPSNSLRSAIIGGNTIKATSATPDTVFMPKVRIGQGVGGAIVTTGSSNTILTLNGTTGEIESTQSSALSSANNGLTKNGTNFKLGGSLTGNTTIELGTNTLNLTGTSSTVKVTNLSAGAGSSSIPSINFGASGIVNGSTSGFAYSINTISLYTAQANAMSWAGNGVTLGSWGAGQDYLFTVAGAGANANRTGSGLKFNGGQSSGNGQARDITFSTSPSGTAGSTINPNVQRLLINGETGNINIPTTNSKLVIGPSASVGIMEQTGVGLMIGGLSAGGGWSVKLVDNGAATVYGTFSPADGGRFALGSTTITNATTYISQGVLNTTGGKPILRLDGGAHFNLSLGTEVNDIDLRLNRTVQFATGALPIQRAVRIQHPTYSFVGPSTATTVSTVSISNAPQAGSNATFINPYALDIEAGNSHFGGSVTIDQVLNLPTYTNSSPKNGDLWFDGTNLRFRLAGVSKTFTLV